MVSIVIGVPQNGWFLWGKIPSRNGWKLGVPPWLWKPPDGAYGWFRNVDKLDLEPFTLTAGLEKVRIYRWCFQYKLQEQLCLLKIHQFFKRQFQPGGSMFHDFGAWMAATDSSDFSHRSPTAAPWCASYGEYQNGFRCVPQGLFLITTIFDTVLQTSNLQLKNS